MAKNRPDDAAEPAGRRKRGVPEGLWIRCPQCKATIFRKEAESRFNVCPECNYHFYLPARERISQLRRRRSRGVSRRQTDALKGECASLSFSG